jgi:hypothetical protein
LHRTEKIAVYEKRGWLGGGSLFFLRVLSFPLIFVSRRLRRQKNPADFADFFSAEFAEMSRSYI